jgi:hypothetical protein
MGSNGGNGGGICGTGGMSGGGSGSPGGRIPGGFPGCGGGVGLLGGRIGGNCPGAPLVKAGLFRGGLKPGPKRFVLNRLVTPGGPFVSMSSPLTGPPSIGLWAASAASTMAKVIKMPS